MLLLELVKAMPLELATFLVMLGVFVVCASWVKLPIGLSLAVASVCGSVVGGFGVPLRHLVEGSSLFLDVIMIIATAMIFMRVLHQMGTVDFITRKIIVSFYRRPAVLLVLLMILIMLPGMFTGSSTVSVLTSGALVAAVLLKLGIPRVETAAIIAMGGLLGMVAPPVNIPVMIIGTAVGMPEVGFTVPLLVMTLLPAFFSVLFLGLKHCRKLQKEDILAHLPEIPRVNGLVLVFPLVVVTVLMVGGPLLPGIMPDLGLPLIFLIGSGIGLATSRRAQGVAVCQEGIRDALPVLAILVGVGMLIQIMTLTGARGLVVTGAVMLPAGFLYLAIATSIPLFGAISAFGAVAVLGVPFFFALLGGDVIIVAAALSLIASVGDLMPPTALAGIFAAQVVGVDNYLVVLRKCLIPAVLVVIIGIIFVIYSLAFDFLVIM